MSVAVQNSTGILYLSKVRISSLQPPLFSRMCHIHGSKVRDGTLHAADAVTSTYPVAVEVATHSVSRLAEMH